MATWAKGIRDAQYLIENVEGYLQGYGYYLHVSLYPYRTNGGRSDGVSAVFENRTPEGNKYICISLYEHWGTDSLCLKFNTWVPCSMEGERHDVPDVQLKYTKYQEQEVTLAIQDFLLQFFDFPLPDGLEGVGDLSATDVERIEELMMPTIMEWCEPPDGE